MPAHGNCNPEQFITIFAKIIIRASPQLVEPNNLLHPCAIQGFLFL